MEGLERVGGSETGSGEDQGRLTTESMTELKNREGGAIDIKATRYSLHSSVRAAEEGPICEQIWSDVTRQPKT